MNKLNILLVLTTILCLSQVALNADLPVIDVYVESLCPDSIDFIGGSFKNYHLNPSRDELAEVNFINFGNASEKWNGERWEFTCQHGPNECYGNTVESCALNRLSHLDGHDFLLCMYGNVKSFNKDIVLTLGHCVFDETLRNDILTCAVGEEGNQLEHQAAQATGPHTHVPWVVVNGVYDKDVEDRILSNMLVYLCELQGNIPQGCNQTLTLNSSHLVNKKSSLNTLNNLYAELSFLE